MNNLKLKVNEIFYSIQGEGVYSGTPAFFIRLSGCNLKCPWCDTDYSKSRAMEVFEVRNEVVDVVDKESFARPQLFVITGGEPLMQDRSVELAFELKEYFGHEAVIAFETNGTQWVPGAQLFHLTVSPKQGAKVLDFIEQAATEYKYVIDSKDVTEDGLPKGCSPSPDSIPIKRVSLQPCDFKDPAKNKEITDFTIQLCKTYGYRLSLQLHKIIGVR